MSKPTEYKTVQARILADSIDSRAVNHKNRVDPA